ncbi:hypothetical protein A8O14_03100 [Polynucleobacter wuianus]|uniref:DUF3305 domain-containing protein n=1 Tax=Polynucleobacter wuianus TaxID=1743168 RepID=A0A191UE55_9BURK|nr:MULTISPECIES: DUF3305 domain-containing protein [Polynucleobacter]ANI99171.1 hypothetical protein A8O14_03100 [Polynucleobacter wuianus]MBU3552251.1 DUF3305 domain-containing protein [Polynucleobacter sp. MWH-Post4-6-1]
MRFAVLMRKQNMDNPWVSYRWAPHEVMPDFGEFNSNSSNSITGQFLGRDNEGESWLFTGFELNLFPDEAEGYYLNVTATTPCWFVMWRLEEDIDRYVDAQSLEIAKADANIAVPHRICVSYNEAARLLDGGESVDTVPMNDEHTSWLQEYVNEKYRPEPKKRHKPASFKGAERPAEK